MASTHILLIRAHHMVKVNINGAEKYTKYTLTLVEATAKSHPKGMNREKVKNWEQ